MNTRRVSKVVWCLALVGTMVPSLGRDAIDGQYVARDMPAISRHAAGAGRDLLRLDEWVVQSEDRVYLRQPRSVCEERGKRPSLVRRQSGRTGDDRSSTCNRKISERHDKNDDSSPLRCRCRRAFDCGRKSASSAHTPDVGVNVQIIPKRRPNTAIDCGLDERLLQCRATCRRSTSTSLPPTKNGDEVLPGSQEHQPDARHQDCGFLRQASESCGGAPAIGGAKGRRKGAHGTISVPRCPRQRMSLNKPRVWRRGSPPKRRENSSLAKCLEKSAHSVHKCSCSVVRNSADSEPWSRNPSRLRDVTRMPIR